MQLRGLKGALLVDMRLVTKKL